MPPEREERGRRQPRELLLGVVGLEQIAGNLLPDELVIGQIAIEGGDDVVAVPVGVRVGQILVETVRLRIADDVEPVPAPTFTVAGRVEQTIDQPGERFGRVVGQEGVDFLRCRRQAVQIERGAADQRPPVGRPRRLQPFRLES